MNYENVEILRDYTIKAESKNITCLATHNFMWILAHSKHAAAADWLRLTQRAAEQAVKHYNCAKFTPREVLAAALEVANYYDSQTEEAA